MKILAIRIKNLASLDGVTEIDFTREPLSSAGIFAITGATGAGKSTILDALCLALYAKTPRYRLAENGIDITDVKGSTIKQDDVRGILRDGASAGYADVDFVGIDGQTYRSCWSVRRARNKADGNLQAAEITLKNISTNQDFPGRKAEVLEETERLAGLNFEQFTRSVLLAQGDFTAFLKAGKDEKSSLLEKLTGTHIYSEISKRVFENHREQLQKLRDLNLQRTGIVTLTTEELNALLQEKAAIETEIQSKEHLAEELRKEETWHHQRLQLEEKVKFAEQQYEKANADKAEAASRQKQLQQIENVQAIRPAVIRLKDAQKQLAEIKDQLKQLNESLLRLQQEERRASSDKEKANNALNLRIKEEEDAKPLLDKAKALDVQLSEKSKQVKQAKIEAESIHKKQQQQVDQWKQNEKETEILEQEIAKHRKWLQDNNARASVAEQESMILSGLEGAAELLKNRRHYESRILSAEKNAEVNQQQRRSLEKKHASIQKSLQLKQTNYAALQKMVTGFDILNMEKARSATNALVEDCIAAGALWKSLYKRIKEKESLRQLLGQNKKELELRLEKLAGIEQELETKKSQRDTSLKILEKARLVAAESVERLRSQLEPGAPCAVCGSTEHPYALHNPVLDHVLTELETSYRESETGYEHHITLQSSLRESCDQINKSITTQETEISRQTILIRDSQKEWHGFMIHAKSENVADDEKEHWLQQELQKHKNNQKQLQEQVANYYNKKQELENLGEDLTLLHTQSATMENDLKEVDRALEFVEKQKTIDAGELKKVNQSLDKVQLDLSAYFTSKQWFANWLKDPNAFTKDIKTFTIEWKKNKEALEKKDRDQIVLAATLKKVQEQIADIRKDADLADQKFNQLQKQWKMFSDERVSIFNGMPVQEMETILSKAVSLARQISEQKNKEAEQLKERFDRNHAQNEQLEKNRAALLEQEIKLKEHQDEWLKNYNHQQESTLSETELTLLLAFGQDWIEAERKSLRTIDDEAMQAESILKERTQTLKKHNEQCLSAKQLEELKTQQKEIGEHLKQIGKRSSEIDFKIREDDANKKQIGRFLQEIEKQTAMADNWAKLNDIIGSADGKKFRQIAQEYTLEVLLSYANIHLEALNRRYVLQRIPGSLGLMVIDQDMGDEVRTVYSLSGGESFLVSLALALGLASLSSSRMKVESLFIDEGFGSLDAATLNIAMDALERLHNQGRKVGVISHVQEMTERIPVQIKVSRQPSGRSKVEVIGA